MSVEAILIAVFQLLTTIGLAVVGWKLTKKQVEIADAKLRLDHFDKRFAVFSAAQNYLGAATRGNITPKDHGEYALGIPGAKFLFKDPAVNKYLEELSLRIHELEALDKLLPRVSGDQRKEVEKKYLAEREWLRAQYEELEKNSGARSNCSTDCALAPQKALERHVVRVLPRRTPIVRRLAAHHLVQMIERVRDRYILLTALTLLVLAAEIAAVHWL